MALVSGSSRSLRLSEQLCGSETLLLPTSNVSFSGWIQLACVDCPRFSLREVGTVDTETTILGIKCSLPIFISPAAMAGLGHPEGEKNIVRGAGKEGLLYGVSGLLLSTKTRR